MSRLISDWNEASSGLPPQPQIPVQGASAFAGQGKPVVLLPGNGITITETAKTLFGLIGPTRTLFMRGRVVVRLGETSLGQTVIEPLSASGARTFFEAYAALWVRRTGHHGEQVLKPGVMAEETARAILDCDVASETLPVINGLVNCPVVVEQGGGLRLLGKGYDADTGLLILAGETPEAVNLPMAVTAIKELVVDFHFQTPGDRSRALAAFVAPALKMGGMLQGPVPADVAEADKSQSGKTYRQKLIAAIYGEKLAGVPLKKGGVGSVDESFFEKLVNGRPFIQFDNFRGKLDSPALEAFFTAEGAFPCRVAHCREIEVDPSRFFVLMTSNGVETTRDMANRSSIVRIYKRPGVNYPDTLGKIASQQAYYLGCVFAVIGEWFRQGKPKTEETRHDFRGWCQPMDWIVQHIFGEAPLMDGHQQAQERVSNPALTFLRKVAIELERQGRLGEPVIASQLFELAEDAEIEVPGLKPGAPEEQAKRVIGAKLAGLFKAESVVECEGFTVKREESARYRAGGDGGSYTVKTYTFTKPGMPVAASEDLPERASAAAQQPQQHLEPPREWYHFPES